MSFFSELKLICGTLDRRMFQSLILLLTVSAFTTMTTPCLAFTQSIRSTSQRELPKTVRKYEPESAAIARLNLCKDRDECDDDVLGRRKWLSSSLVAATTLWGSSILPAMAEGTEATATVVEMKDFVDPVGYFSIRIPKYFFALRRSAKGDLPDPKTGQGRRGSSIFTAGDMRKAELVAVERFPTRVLLEENGIEATGDLTTFQGLGEPSAVANLLNLRRERDKPGMSNSAIVPDSLYITSDGKELGFKVRSEIEVQKPELLLEQYGVSELFRITLAKATLNSNDGNLMAVFASALETDFNGPDGQILREAVDSFRVMDQSAATN